MKFESLPAALRTTIAVDRDVRIMTIERRGLCGDTRVVPAWRGAPRAVDAVWFVLSGSVTWGDERGEHTITAPAVLRMSERDFDGAHGMRDRWFRAWGDTLEIRFRVPRARGGSRVRPPPRTIPCSEATWRCARAYADHQLGPSSSLERTSLAVALLEALVTEGELPAAIPPSIVRVEEARLARVWSELAAAYRDLDTNPSLKQLAHACGVSMRHVARLVSLVQRNLLLPLGGWRGATGGLRLRIALMFLTSPSISIAEIAHAVGYRHAAAMTNAFERAGLPSPREVRARLLRNGSASLEPS